MEQQQQQQATTATKELSLSLSSIGSKKNEKKMKKRLQSEIVSSQDAEKDIVVQSSIISSTTTTTMIEKPALYTEDIGECGIKKQKTINTPSEPILKFSSNIQKNTSMTSIAMSMKLTKDDIIKIKERKSRFGNVDATTTTKPVESKKTTNNNNNQQDEKFVLRALSSSRDKGSSSSSSIHTSNKPQHYYEQQQQQFIGTNTNIEKDYLRLTTYPRIEEVRPLYILQKSLEHIKTMYIQTENYDWVTNQLKSIRQDIVCQNIRTNFVLDVYETHARILLEHGNLNEFNQCQTMIRTLTEGNSNSNNSTTDVDSITSYNTTQNGDSSTNTTLLKQSKESEKEFRSYALLYALVRNSRLELIRELDRMKHFLLEHNQKQQKQQQQQQQQERRRKSPQVVNDENIMIDSTNDDDTSYCCCCYYALEIVTMIESRNYNKFFYYYTNKTPHMIVYIMDFLLKRVRDDAYECIIASYRPTITIQHIHQILYFDTITETKQFLDQHNTVYVSKTITTTTNGTTDENDDDSLYIIDCKASQIQKQQQKNK